MLERFLKYVKIDTQSNENTNKTPSTDSQIEFAKILNDDLHLLGINSIIDEYGFVKGFIKGNSNYKSIGLLAHYDTALELSGKCNPQVINNYDGKDIKIGDYILSPNEFESLNKHIGKTIITTSGDTLLGADDKCGVVIIIEALKHFLKNDNHGDIYFAFTPDEEIGEGIKKFDTSFFNVDYCYTIDGSELGEIEYENFNAARAIVKIKGKSIHPGDAYKKMINASNVAMEFHSMLPIKDRPENTKLYEGFNHLLQIESNVEYAKLTYIIRNHDMLKFNEQKELFISITDSLNKKYNNIIELDLKDQYYNMYEIIKKDLSIIDIPIKAMKELNIKPFSNPIRGGTDGSFLTQMGLPCPNLPTGSYNHHGRYEYAVLEDMKKISELIIKIAELAKN